MTVTINGDTGISSPGGDTASVSYGSPILKSASSLTFQTNGSTTAMTINTSQNVLVNTPTARTAFFNGSNTPLVQIEGTSFATASQSIVRNSADAAGSFVILGKTRGAAVGGTTIVSTGDVLGVLSFQGSDGTELVESARIASAVDAAPGANDMPGNLIFSTTADGASSSSERMRIDSSGNVGINVTSPVTSTTTALLQVGGGILIPGNNLGLATNLYYQSGWKYSTNGSGGYINMARSSTVAVEIGIATNNGSGSGASASPTAALSINTNGAIALTNAVTTATGIGITFPATQSASTNANTLDDYEEGTWTPAINFSGGTTGITYSALYNRGWYTRVGNVVTCTMACEVTNKGSSTGNLEITGLPFNSTQGDASVSHALSQSSMTVANPIFGYGTIPSGNLGVYKQNSGNQSNVTNSDCPTVFSLLGTIVYLI